MTNSRPQSPQNSAANGQGLALAPAPRGELPSCWNSRGVFGTGDCPELKQFIHCHNCPVYASAGLRVLNRPLPRGYRRAWTLHFSREKNIVPPGDTSAVLFSISAEWFGLPTQALQEVAEHRPIHSLPHRRQGIVLGLTNIRGELLICVSLGHLLGLERTPSREALRSAHRRLLVVKWNDARLAFPADEIQGTHRFPAQELKAPPATVAKSSPTYTQGVLYWRERAVGYLDADRLFAALNRTLT